MLGPVQDALLRPGLLACEPRIARYRIGVVAATFALGLALMPLGAIEYGSWAAALAVKVAAVIVFVLALRPLGVVGPGDLRRARMWALGR